MTPEIKEVFRYFSRFKYPPSEDEIYTFLKKRTSLKDLKEKLTLLKKKHQLKQGYGFVYPGIKTTKYTLEEYGIFLNKNKRYSLLNRSKLKSISFYIFLLSKLPQIKFVGLTGSISMMHADSEDDIDLFIITAKNRLWTARLQANVLAIILKKRRKRLSQQAKDKICLNLFFEESNLKVPAFKQNEYIGHEILQVKPLINKNRTYERFLSSNQWVYKFFPNARVAAEKHIKPLRKHIKKNENRLGTFFESIFKRIQLSSIKKHKTSEIITNTQLWFFPDDFERKILRYNRSTSRSGGIPRQARDKLADLS